MLEQLVSMVVVGLVAGGAACLLRALPWPAAWKERKPLGCPTCSAGWMAWVALGYLFASGQLPFVSLFATGFVWLGATGIGAAVNAVALPAPAVLPDLFKES